MHLFRLFLFTGLLGIISCKDNVQSKPLVKGVEKKIKIIPPIKKKEIFLLDDKNAIPFFFEYQKKNK